MKALLITISLFFTLHGVLRLPLLNPGEPLSEDWVVVADDETAPWTLPFDESLTAKETMSLSTMLPATKGLSLVFLRLNATAFTAAIDGMVIESIGDHENATANLWNSIIVVPITDSTAENRTLTLTLSGHQVLSISRLPFLEERGQAERRWALHRLLYHDMVHFFMGAAVLVGIILIIFASHRRSSRTDGWLLGLSCLSVAIYALDFTYRPSTGEFLFYHLSKRLVIASAYISSFTFLAAMDHLAYGRFRLSRWLAIPNLIALLLVVSSPTVGIMNQRLVWVNALVLVNLSSVIVLVMRELRTHFLYMIAAGLIMLATIQVVVIMTINPDLPAVLQYVVVVVSLLLGLQFLRDFREVYKDRDQLRNVYDKDALTSAYNRRALESINLQDFGSAVFLDFDSFKPYNDQFGHEQGDELLKDFVRETRSHLRKEDVIIRYGGDEFLILLSEPDEAAVVIAIERVREGFRALAPDGGVDISYGIEILGKGDRLDLDTLDKRMYAMKMAKKRS